MFIVPRSYYKHKRSLFQFFNYEYLEADGHFILRIIGTNARYIDRRRENKSNVASHFFFLFSDFVATKIIHKSYVICCEKRFRAFEVEKRERASRATLYKYLIIPKEGQQNERNQSCNGSETNLFPPLPLPRSSSTNANDNLSSSDIGPAALDPGREQHLSKRSQSKPEEI